MKRIIKTYSQAMAIPSFEDRFRYLADGLVNSGSADQTFGVLRYLNQQLYRSREWRNFRNYILVRDGACDLAHPDHPLDKMAVLHHIVPLEPEDIENKTIFLMDPEYVITTAEMTHKAIHANNPALLPHDYIPRSPNDTCPWLL